MRLLMLSDSAEPSGVGVHMCMLALALGEGVTAQLVFADTAAGRSMQRRAQAAGLDASCLPLDALARGSRAVRRLVQCWQPDLVHIHAGIAWEGHALAASARAAGRCIVRTEHLPYTLRALRDPALEQAYARGVQGVARIICVCDAARQTFRMAAVEPGRYCVVPNAVVPQRPRCSRAQARTALGIGDAPLVLTVARLSEQKRHATLLAALPRLLQRYPGMRLAWVGRGPLEGALRAQVQSSGMAQRVLFLGERHDVPDLLAAADIFCLPSYFEGHPLVILEAMAAGLPVVAARSLGITEAVRHEENGLLYPYDHAPLLAHMLARVLGEAGLAQRLLAAGKRTAQDCSVPRMAARTMAVYRTAMGTGTRTEITDTADTCARNGDNATEEETLEKAGSQNWIGRDRLDNFP